MTEQLVRFVHAIRSLDLKKAPAISETVDWAKAGAVARSRPRWSAGRDTLNVLLNMRGHSNCRRPVTEAHDDRNRLITMPSPPEAQATPQQAVINCWPLHYLRGKKIPVSPADTLDAIEVVELTGYADKTLLKNGLPLRSPNLNTTYSCLRRLLTTTFSRLHQRHQARAEWPGW